MDYSRGSMNIVVAIALVLLSRTEATVVSAERPPIAVPPPNSKVWGYNTANGTGKKDIMDNFNLLRGRWWNYFERGSWYLAYGYYQEARQDFEVVIEKRPTDKRDARTYGMHFRDCFGHRELGITLYFLAMREGAEVDKLSLLEESIKQLDLSWQHAPSSRGAYFRNLAEGNFWKNSGRDVTGPSISVENAARKGENWAVVVCNRSIVELNIHVTDYQSGVREIWVDDKSLFLEKPDRSITRTVHKPADIHDRWIVIRARDLAGNDSWPITVKVQRDTSPPLILTTISPDEKMPQELIAVEYSAQDNLGLRMIQMENQTINCNDRRQCEGVFHIKTTPDKSNIELAVVDLAGNITKGVVDLPRRNSHTRKRMVPISSGSGFVKLWHWTKPTWPRTSLAFSLDNTLHLPLWASVDAKQDTYIYDQPILTTLETTSSTASPLMSPEFVFDDYRDVEGGYRVRGEQYLVQGMLKYADEVTGVAVDESTIEFKPRNGENVTLRFSEPVHLPNTGMKEIEVSALYENDRVPYFKPLKVKRVEDPIMALSSVYDIIVLPLEQKYVPGNSKGVHRTPEMTYEKIKQAFEECQLYDSNSYKPFARFDCSAMKDLDANNIEARIADINDSSLGYKVLELGKRLREEGTGVDLGVFGTVVETPNDIEIRLDVADIETRENLTAGRPIDIFVSKGQPGWQRKCIEGLTSKLVTRIPRVSGQVTRKPYLSDKIVINRGKDNDIFLGTHLCIFLKKTDNNELRKVVEAAVTTLEPSSSEAVVVESSDAEGSIKNVRKGLMFITK
jgi:hypothetical protein